MRRVSSSLVCLYLFVGMIGCSKDDDRDGNEAAPTPTPTVSPLKMKKVTGDVAKAKGRAYYITEKGYTCITQVERAKGDKAESIATWKESATVGNGVIAYVDRGCNDAVLELKMIDLDYSFNADYTTLTFKGKTFRYSENPPKE